MGGRHHCNTISFEGDITKTGQKVLLGKGVHRNRKKSMTEVSDKTIQSEVLRNLFKKVRKNFC